MDRQLQTVFLKGRGNTTAVLYDSVEEMYFSLFATAYVKIASVQHSVYFATAMPTSAYVCAELLSNKVDIVTMGSNTIIMPSQSEQ